MLVEEYIEGSDVAVGFIEGVGHDDGLLTPVEMLYDQGQGEAIKIYDYRLKNVDPGKVQYRCPANLPRDVAARLRQISHEVLRTLGLRDVARLDFRVTPEGRIYLLEVNALPALATSSSLFAATAQVGLTYNATIAAVLNAAALRSGLAIGGAARRHAHAQGAADPRRLHVQRQARGATAMTRPSGIRRRPSSRSPTRSRARVTSWSTSRPRRTCRACSRKPMST